VVSFTPLSLYSRKKSTGTHWIRGWVGPRADLDDEKRKFLTLLGLELRSQSLYRLGYPGFQHFEDTKNIRDLRTYT
jgi:hypothetical protein